MKLHDITTYQPSYSDIFFFDTNVWMFLFCPIGGYKKEKQRKYSDFFNKVVSSKACIWINSLVLSEFTNAWLRIAFNDWKKIPANIGKNNYKQHFVPTASYKSTIEEIRPTLEIILKKAERATDDFNSISIDHIFRELENCDFNDSYYIELASRHKWKIVTDDADLFKNNNLNAEIISANL